MAPRPDLSRYLDAGTEFVALTRSQARARARELVGQGQLAQEQVQGFVDDLVDESRRRTDEMLDVVRREIQRQVKTLGIATKDDLARLERRIGTGSAPSRPAKKATKTAAKRTTKRAKKTPTRKSTTKTTKQTAKKGSKATARKGTPKRATKRVTAAKRSSKRSSKSAG